MFPSLKRANTVKNLSDSDIRYDEAGLRQLEMMVQMPQRKEKRARMQRAVSDGSHFWRRSQSTKTLDTPLQPRKPAMHQTAYLDGLRGFAAFLVFNLHHEIWAHSSSVVEFGLMENTYGSEGHHLSLIHI